MRLCTGSPVRLELGSTRLCLLPPSLESLQLEDVERVTLQSGTDTQPPFLPNLTRLCLLNNCKLLLVDAALPKLQCLKMLLDQGEVRLLDEVLMPAKVLAVSSACLAGVALPCLLTCVLCSACMLCIRGMDKGAATKSRSNTNELQKVITTPHGLPKQSSCELQPLLLSYARWAIRSYGARAPGALADLERSFVFWILAGIGLMLVLPLSPHIAFTQRRCLHHAW